MDIIEIAKECGIKRYTAENYEKELQQFAQRIQQPLLNQVENQRLNCEVAYRYAFYMRDISIQRDVLIAELEAFAVNRNARIAELEQELHYATQAARFEADMCEQAMADMKQLREALQLMVDTHDEGGWPSATVVIARKVLEGK